MATQFYEKDIKNGKSSPTTALLKEEQRDLSWYVNTGVSTTKPVVYPATCSVSESVVSAPLTNCYQSVEYAPTTINVPRRAPRSTRNPAPVHATKQYHRSDPEDADGISSDETRIAVAKWIKAHEDPYADPKRLAGDELIKFTDSASFSAGNCKGPGAKRSTSSPFPPLRGFGRANHRAWLVRRLKAKTLS